MSSARAVAGVLVLAALIVAAQAYGQFPLTADECLTGVTAQQVVAGRFPVWLGGNRHYGALKAYLDAPFVALFGPVDWTLRAASGICMVFDVAVVMGGVWLLLGRRAGLAAGALVAMYPPRLAYWLLSGCAVDTYVALWYCLPLPLVYVLRRPAGSARAGFLLGFLSGVSQWAAAQSLLIYGPALLAWLLITRGLTRLLVWPLGFALGSLPWWWDGLRHGFFRDSASYLGFTQTLGGRLGQAWDNWKYYAFSQSHEIFEPARWTWLALPALIATALAVLGALVAMVREVRGRERLFWWSYVGGVTVLWCVAIGFTPPGAWRLGVHRYTLPVVCLLPYLLGLASRKWSDRVLVTVVLLMGLPALADSTARLLDHRPQRAAYQQVDQIRQQIDQVGATYLIGSWWDTGCHSFHYAGRVAVMMLADDAGDPALPLDQELPNLVAAPGPGVLLVRRGSLQERGLEQRGWLQGLQPLPGPPDLGIYAVPAHPEAGQPGFCLAALGAYGRQAQRFVEKMESSVELGAGLRGDNYTWTPEGSKVFHGRQAYTQLVIGPHILVPPGRYRAEFRLECTWSPCRVDLDVLADSVRPLWKESYQLQPGESTVRQAAFEVTRETFLETRVFVGERAGPGEVTVNGVRLVRESPTKK